MNHSAVTAAVSASARPSVTGSVFTPHPALDGFTPLRVEGALPAALRGTFYRNGPGRFDVGPDPHWFDGNGAITAVRFDGRGGASGALRYTETATMQVDTGCRHNRYGAYHQRSSRAQRVRALFGATPVRNSANINLLSWQGRLFALFEGSKPVEIDPVTLATLGERELEGVTGRALNAHPHRVAGSDTVYQFGIRIGRAVSIDVYALPAAGPARHLTSFELPGVMEVHDFFVTASHLVFVLPPLWCSSLALLAGGSFAQSLKWHGAEPTRVVVIPLDAPDQHAWIETEPFFYWHAANAFEANGEIVLDFIRYPDFATTSAWLDRTPRGLADVPGGSALWRGRIARDRRAVSWECRWDRVCEFPVVRADEAGMRAGSTWCAAFSEGNAGYGWPDSFARVNLETGHAHLTWAGPGCAVSEPTVVTSNQGQDPYLLSLVRDFDAERSFVGVWAGDGDEPVARVWFDQLVPHPLHGCWVQA